MFVISPQCSSPHTLESRSALSPLLHPGSYPYKAGTGHGLLASSCPTSRGGGRLYSKSLRTMTRAAQPHLLQKPLTQKPCVHLTPALAHSLWGYWPCRPGESGILSPSPRLQAREHWPGAWGCGKKVAEEGQGGKEAPGRFLSWGDCRSAGGHGRDPKG